MTNGFSFNLCGVLARKIEARLKFYSLKRCMHCGSDELTVDYDAENYVSYFVATANIKIIISLNKNFGEV